jgi:hypothetical protein
MKSLRLLGRLLLAIYFIGFMVSALVFNWQYGKSSGFFEWLLLGEIVPTAKALIWPVYLIRGGDSRSSSGGAYEVHCSQPLPAFTLGEKSSPTPDQEAALCTCIWENLVPADRKTLEATSQGGKLPLSRAQMREVAVRFGAVVERCGGKDL